MSRVIFSALLSDARNKIGDVVFSSWKGRSYVRTRVIPANPRTQKQVEQRTTLARMVAIWKQFDDLQQDSWKYSASARNVSGFNQFISENVVAEKTDYARYVSGLNPNVPAPSNLQTGDGPQGGDLRISWEVGSADSNDAIRVIYRVQGQTDITIVDPAGVTIGDTEYIISGLEPEDTYVVYLMAHDEANGLSRNLVATGQPFAG